jgi:hypothetical protein
MKDYPNVDPDEHDLSARARADGASDDLALALDGIERLRTRIAAGGGSLTSAQAGRMAMALSMIDAALGDAVRALHAAAAEPD